MLRRGRGESTDTQPYAVEREIEDIEALITEAGGSAFVFGISSGAALAMEAAIKLGDKVKKLAMYEVPYNSDEAARLAWKAYRKQLAEVLAHGRRGDALALFMMLVGMPADHLDRVRQHPLWPMWEAGAPTLAYDAAIMGEDASVPTEKAARVAVPTLVMDGSASFPFMHVTATALANAIPNAEHRTLEGQTHEVEAGGLAPVRVGAAVEFPAPLILPSSISRRTSASFAIVRSCVTTITVLPCSASVFNNSMMRFPFSVSRLPVGSSARITLGSLASARAIATRCCCPPESLPGVWFCHFSPLPTLNHHIRALLPLPGRDRSPTPSIRHIT